ncbi:ribonuclease P protein subunit p25 [Lissotriton helveticus]
MYFPESPLPQRGYSVITTVGRETHPPHCLVSGPPCPSSAPGVQSQGATAAEGPKAAPQTTAPPIPSGMENFRKVKTSERVGPPPFPGLPAGAPEMKVKEGSKIRNLMGFSVARMGAEGTRQIVFSGCGRAVTKVVTCVEILKRRLPGLQQATRVHYRALEEVWEKDDPRRPGHVERLVVHKNVPAISILLSKDPWAPREEGRPPLEGRKGVWGDLDFQQVASTPPVTEKRPLECPSQAGMNKMVKVEAPPMAHIRIDYMLSCYSQAAAHLSGNAQCLYSA